MESAWGATCQVWQVAAIFPELACERGTTKNSRRALPAAVVYCPIITLLLYSAGRGGRSYFSPCALILNGNPERQTRPLVPYVALYQLSRNSASSTLCNVWQCMSESVKSSVLQWFTRRHREHRTRGLTRMLLQRKRRTTATRRRRMHGTRSGAKWLYVGGKSSPTHRGSVLEHI